MGVIPGSANSAAVADTVLGTAKVPGRFDENTASVMAPFIPAVREDISAASTGFYKQDYKYLTLNDFEIWTKLKLYRTILISMFSPPWLLWEARQRHHRRPRLLVAVRLAAGTL